MKTRSITDEQKAKVTELLIKNEVVSDDILFDIIEDLNRQLTIIDLLFEGDINSDREMIKRDYNRIKRIFHIVDELEDRGHKSDFQNRLIELRPLAKHSYFLPAANGLNKFLVDRCHTIASVLIDRSDFKSGQRLYSFLARLVNILRPDSFPGDRFGELTDGEFKAFQTYLLKLIPNPPPKRKLKP